jgi:hypothetical protein
MLSFKARIQALTRTKETLELIVSTDEREGDPSSYYSDLDHFCNYMTDVDINESHSDEDFKDIHPSGLPQSVVQRLAGWLQVYKYMNICIYLIYFVCIYIPKSD